MNSPSGTQSVYPTAGHLCPVAVFPVAPCPVAPCLVAPCLVTVFPVALCPITACLVAVLTVIGSGPRTFAAPQLPSESQLPGSVRSLEHLPPESVLPKPMGQGIDPAPVSIELPTESSLPQESAPSLVTPEQPQIQPAAGDVDQDELPTDEPDRPWLRLLMNGPTAPLRTLRFSEDSQQLLGAGDDKALHIWRLVDPQQNQARWIYQESVYWQVQRAARGAIRSIATSGRWILFGGVGATALTGEIGLVDSQTGRLDRCLFDEQIGPQAEIASLTQVATGDFAALDLKGQLTLWQRNPETGLWQANVIRSRDEARFDAETTDTLARFRRFGSAITGTPNGHLVFAEPDGSVPVNPAPQWNLVLRDIASGAERSLAAPRTHAGGVPALTMSQDGQRIVSADLTDGGRWFAWDLSRSNTAVVAQIGSPVRTVSLSPSGKILLIGTANGPDGSSQASVWRWDADGQLQPLASWRHQGPILSGCISPDERWLAYTLDGSIWVRAIDAIDEPPRVLRSTAVAARDVAFTQDDEPANRYRIKIASAESGQEPSDAIAAWTFDPQQPALVDAEPAAQDGWQPHNPHPDRWRLQTEVDAQTGSVRWQVSIDGRGQCTLPLDSNADGIVTAECWISAPGDPQRPAALAVGTNKRSHILLFQIVPEGAAPLIRQFRGHSAAVRALSVSTDLRYLVSSSDDSTIRFWKLDDCLDPEQVLPTRDAWGAELEIRDQRLYVRDLISDGPLFYRGVRVGDEIVAVSWQAAGETEMIQQQDAEQILATLTRPDWRRMIRFDTRLDQVRQPHFYLHPAWQPLASLVVTADREWAFWSPYGYYDASVNGHRQFGWQFNRGVEQAPDFFRAAEMKQDLERPDMMKRLLAAGSVTDAFLALRQVPPENLHQRLAIGNRLRPRVRIHQPAPGTVWQGSRQMVEAEIELPHGVQLRPPRVFVNGVPAPAGQRISSETDGNVQRHVVRWTAELPRDRQLRIQVLASSELGTTDVASVDIEHTLPEDAAGPSGRLFLIAAGVNQYADAQIPRLEFAVNNVRAIRESLADTSGSLRDVDATLLFGDSVNRPLWRIATQRAVEQLRDVVRPDDLIVIFLSGHGVSDPVSGEYFFVAPAARYDDLLGRQYADCISLDDFAVFRELNCRKLVILDTRESGTFSPADQQDLKPLVRALENDMFFTLTAAEGAADAYESTQDQLSFLTASLIAGLRGEADRVGDTRQPDAQQPDGRVDWSELVRFVTNRVPAEIARIGKRQYPSASPKELLEFAEIPLVAVPRSE